MEPQELTDRLSAIKTQWTVLLGAQQGRGDGGAADQGQMLLRYYGAAYRYLLGMLGDKDEAENLTNEFARRFMEGDFARADPRRGRFRDYLKKALRNLVQDEWRRQKADRKRGLQPLPAGDAGMVAAAPPDPDEEFRRAWVEELHARAWEGLEQAARESGTPYHTLLSWKTEQPQVRSAELAERLRAKLKRPFSESGVRQLLHRAREKFADLLVEEVGRSLQTSEPKQVEEELIDLKLLCYCRAALQRRSGPG